MKKYFAGLLIFIFNNSFSQCPWSIADTLVTAPYGCAGMWAAMVFSITGPTSDLRYFLTNYPPGVVVSPSNAALGNVNPALNGTSSQTVVVNRPGTYVYKVTNTLTNCQQSGTINLVPDIPDFQIQASAPSTSASCNGVGVITPSPGPNTTVSVSMGTLSGSQINGLCYGALQVCVNQNACYICHTLTINGTMGLKEINEDDQIKIYPNPARGNFFVTTEQGTIQQFRIFNTCGKTERLIVAFGNNKIESGVLDPGIYFVEIISENFRCIKKVIVLRE